MNIPRASRIKVWGGLAGLAAVGFAVVGSSLHVAGDENARPPARSAPYVKALSSCVDSQAAGQAVQQQELLDFGVSTDSGHYFFAGGFLVGNPAAKRGTEPVGPSVRARQDECICDLDCADGDPCTNDWCDLGGGRQIVGECVQDYVGTDTRDCDDSATGTLYCQLGKCDGTGTCVPDDGGSPCATGYCEDEPDVRCHVDADCATGSCVDEEVCQEATDRCEHEDCVGGSPGDPCSDDGRYCNGEEICDANLQCVNKKWCTHDGTTVCTQDADCAVAGGTCSARRCARFCYADWCHEDGYCDDDETVSCPNGTSDCVTAGLEGPCIGTCGDNYGSNLGGPCDEDDDCGGGVGSCEYTAQCSDGSDTIGRCCWYEAGEHETCDETLTLAECENQHPTDGKWECGGHCECPKYSSGWAPRRDWTVGMYMYPINNQPCEGYYRVGDDYTLINDAYLEMAEFKFIGGVDCTGNGALLFEFWDDSEPPVKVDDRGVQFTCPEHGGYTFMASFTWTEPVLIPPVGYVTLRAYDETSTEIGHWKSTDAVDVGNNNPTLLWVNDVRGPHLSPNDPDILAFEFVGEKVPGEYACCAFDTGDCTLKTPWDCEAEGDISLYLDGVTTCTPNPCGTGACCLADGTCCDRDRDEPTDPHPIPDCFGITTSQTLCEGAGGEWRGFGSDCDPDCCEQPPPSSGADDCDAATLLAHQIQVPLPGLCDTDLDCDPLNNEVCVGYPGAKRCMVQITISGDNTLATYGMCNPGSDDRGWYEAFNFVDEFGAAAQCARVTIDECCTFDPVSGEVPGAGYIILIRDCSEAALQCGALVFSDEYGWSPFCGPDDNNIWNLWEAIPGGLYHYPVLSIDTEEEYPSTLFPYQLHISVAGCDEYACCLPQDDNCPPALPDKGCIEANRVACDAAGGWLLTDTPICNFPVGTYTCELGACCPEPGECDDNDGAGMLCGDCFVTADAKFYGGARCEDDPCPVCPFWDDDHCIYDGLGEYMVYDDRCRGTPYPRWADDFVAGTTGNIEEICWWPCFYDPVAKRECHNNPPVGVDNTWQVVFYADNAGMPGTIIGGPMIVTPMASALFPGYRCHQYSASLPQAVPVVEGQCYWIEITGEGDCDGCQVYWMSNRDGNMYSMRDADGAWGPEDVVFILGEATTTSPYDPSVDMSFCIDLGLGDPEDCGEILGACIICGEEGPECEGDPDETHIECRDEWAPDEDPDGIAFFPGDNCDYGVCNDGVTVCCVTDQDCPPGLEPCVYYLLPPPPENDNCDTDAIAIHTGARDDLCATLPCTFDFDNTCANTDGPDPECGTDFGSDIWYAFYTQVGECGWITIDTCTNGTHDGIIAFYGQPYECGAECPVNSASMQSCGDDSCGVGGGMPYIGDPAPPWPKKATDPIYVCGDDPDKPGLNRYYLIRMGGWGGEYGSGQMTISWMPGSPHACDPEVCPPCGVPPHRPLAEDCATLGDPLCADGVTSCNVSTACNRPCPAGLEPCTFQQPGTRCQNNPAVPCQTDADCNNESICVPPPTGQEDEPYPYDYYCYAPKTRYLSIKASPKQPPGTARRVTMGWCEDDLTLDCIVNQDCIDQGAAGPCVAEVLGWVGEPYANGADVHSDPYMVAQVVDEADRYYAQTWPDIVHVHTCEIAHASLCDITGDHCRPNNCPGHPDEQCINHRYGIQAIVAGEDITDEEAYSEALWLNTNGTWGDSVGNCAGNVCYPADGLPGLDDIMAAIGYFTGCQDVAPLVWLDKDPSNASQCPEQIVGLGDIMSSIAGFQGGAYPGLGPKECP